MVSSRDRVCSAMTVAAADLQNMAFRRAIPRLTLFSGPNCSLCDVGVKISFEALFLIAFRDTDRESSFGQS